MREKLIELLTEYYGVDPAYYGIEAQHLADHLIANGVTIPVRCKDCKYGILDDDDDMWKCVYSAEFSDENGEWFGFIDYNVASHFCSYGERKGDGNG